MLGAIIGDIVGSRYEFDSTNDYNFEMFAQGSNFTDDSICTIAVADALLKGEDFGESLHRWCRKYPYPKGGYGGRFLNWVRSDNPLPYGSFGNGSAMRVSPIGWWYGSESEVLEAAKKSADCSHNHPEGIKGAQAVALAIHDCRKGLGLNRAIAMYADEPENFTIDLDFYRNRFDETCQGTVPVALWILLNSTGFEDAVRKAVSLGGDADTLGAIVGSIAEAIWGIPQWMREKALAYLPEEMHNVITNFEERVSAK